MTDLIRRSSQSVSGAGASLLAVAGLSAATLFAIGRFAARVSRPPVNLRGKIALVTGGSRGLGLAVAEELAGYGCDVALCARDEDELKQAQEKLHSFRTDVAIFPCDLSKPDEVTSLADRVLARHGRIDILVNNAGLIQVAPFDNLEKNDFDAAMNLMFWGPVNLTLAVLPHMRKQGSGHIVNITSVGGRVAVPHLLPYSCAKFALVGFSTGLSAELDPEEVHVLTVVPGLMRTGSYLHVPYKGHSSEEFAWFGLLSNLPGFSVAADYAARSIRESLQRRQATCTISLPAKLLIQAEALMPEATRTVMQLATRFVLPPAASQSDNATGKTASTGYRGLFQALTRLGRMAAAELNQ